MAWTWLYRNPSKWDQAFRVDNFLSLQIKLLEVFGLSTINFRPHLPKWLGFLSPILNALIYLTLASSNVYLVVLFGYDAYRCFATDAPITQITNDLSMIIINSFSLFARAHFVVKDDECRQMADFVNKNFLFRSAPGVTAITTEQTHLWAKRFTVCWAVVSSLGCLQWILMPLYLGSRIHPIHVDHVVFNQLVSESIITTPSLHPNLNRPSGESLLRIDLRLSVRQSILGVWRLCLHQCHHRKLCPSRLRPIRHSNVQFEEHPLHGHGEKWRLLGTLEVDLAGFAR